MLGANCCAINFKLSRVKLHAGDLSLAELEHITKSIKVMYEFVIGLVYFKSVAKL